MRVRERRQEIPEKEKDSRSNFFRFVFFEPERGGEEDDDSSFDL